MTTALRTARTQALARIQAPDARGFLRRYWWVLLLASVGNMLAVARVQYLGALVAVTCAAFLLLRATRLRHALFTGLGFMCGTAMLLNYWMLPVVLNYTGGNWLMAIGCYVASWAFMTPFFAAQFGLFALLRRRARTKFDHVCNAVLFAATWVLFEWLRAYIFSAIPFMSYAWGSAAGQNTLLLQPAAIGGVFALSFLLAFPAYFIAWAVEQRNLRTALPAFAVLLVQLIGGWALYTTAAGATDESLDIEVALVQPALTTDLTWDPQNGNALVQRLLTLNRQATARHPQVIAWTETTVPWTYRADDDFLQVLAQSTKTTGSYTLLGMSSDGDATDSLRSNSLYLLDPEGALKGRYDKQELLAGAERPFMGGLMLPFGDGSNRGFRRGIGGPVPTPWGKAGLMLCNEATIPAQAAARADSGASWLAVLGNDAWFADTYVAFGHFNQCRVRAVEIRKDVLVNINMGEAGVIRASGEVASRFDGTEAAVRSVTIQPNSNDPPSHALFNIFIVLAFATCNRFFQNKNNKTKPHDHEKNATLRAAGS